MSKKIYISGRITGRELADAEKHFESAEKHLESLGHKPINPMKIDHDHDKSWLNYMRHDIRAMMEAEAIYMLRGWELSRGAKVEFHLAHSLDLEIHFEK